MESEKIKGLGTYIKKDDFINVDLPINIFNIRGEQQPDDIEIATMICSIEK